MWSNITDVFLDIFKFRSRTLINFLSFTLFLVMEVWIYMNFAQLIRRQKRKKDLPMGPKKRLKEKRRFLISLKRPSLKSTMLRKPVKHLKPTKYPTEVKLFQLSVVKGAQTKVGRP